MKLGTKFSSFQNNSNSSVGKKSKMDSYDGVMDEGLFKALFDDKITKTVAYTYFSSKQTLV